MTPNELRARRQALGLSQERLGRALGISPNTVARWERGEQRLANPTLVRLALDQLASEPATGPSPTTTARPAQSGAQLPAATASFVGRRAEVQSLRRLCARRRLVTLTGAAGVGKTRLALEVAARLSARSRVGTWLIELAPLTEPAQVAQAVAARLRIRERPGQSVVELLVDVLGDQPVLLVLDNCEHLLDACAALVEGLSRGCAGLRILATSRQALGLEGELVWRVPPLGLPAAGAATVPELLACEAVALFVERAQTVQPAFALTAPTAPVVAEICRQLDGLPLAIELAAARMQVLAPAQLLERLTDRFRVLKAEQRRAPVHHQALQATLDWSWALLSGSERALFQRLSIFAGGFTLEAAEAICTSDDIPVGDVLTLLARLVGRSLVVAEPAVDGVRRYGLLQTLREYGAERLRASGEARSLAERHCEWCLVVVERFDLEWRGPAQAEWFERLEHEHANVVAALRWCVQSGEIDRGLRLAGAAWRFWEVRGYLSQGRAWLARLLDAGGPATRARARALDAAGHLAILQDDQASGLPLVHQSLALACELGDDLALVNGHHSLGLAAQYRHEYPLAAEMHTASLDGARAIGDMARTYVALYNLAVVAQKQGEFEQATALHEESLALKREAGDSWSIGYSLLNLGLLAWIRGEYAPATAFVQDSLHLRRELGDKPGIAYCLETMAEIDASQGRGVPAARLFGAADALLHTIGVRLLAPLPGGLPRGTEAVRAQLGDASFTSAYATGRALPLERAIAEALAPGQPLAATPSRRSWVDLTRREVEVAGLVASGLTNRQIAARLTIAEGTAQRHVANILAKLGFASRAEVAAWSVTQRLVDT